jgi:hypothetical protein
MFQRTSAGGFDPNILGFTLAIGLPISYYLILRENGPVSPFYRLQTPFAVCGVLLFRPAAGTPLSQSSWYLASPRSCSFPKRLEAPFRRIQQRRHHRDNRDQPWI